MEKNSEVYSIDHDLVKDFKETIFINK